MIEGRIGRVHRKRMAGKRDPGWQCRRRRVPLDGEFNRRHLERRALAEVGIARAGEQIRRKHRSAFAGLRGECGRRHGRVVGSGDGDGDRGRDLSVMVIVDLNGIDQRHGLACRQIIETPVLRRERPALRPDPAVLGIDQGTERQPRLHDIVAGQAACHSGGADAGDRDTVGVGAIAVGEADLASGGVWLRRARRAGISANAPV